MGISAHSEADMVRQAVDLVQPFGSMQGSPSAIAIVDDHVAVLDAEKPLLYRYQKQDKQWKAQPPLQLRYGERSRRDFECSR